MTQLQIGEAKRMLAQESESVTEVVRMEEFIRSQLGDARTFSLDSPKSRIPRIEALQRTALG